MSCRIIVSVLLVALIGCKSEQPQATSSTHDSGGTTVSDSGDTSMGSSSTTQPSGVHGIRMKDIDGQERSLAQYNGKPVLIVNVASQCGFTKQYAGLQKLYDTYKDKGLVVIGVPSNDFGGQEPGTEAEIKEFCTSKYAVTFPLMAKVPVKKGPEQAELYQYLTSKERNGVLDATVAWNFNKFLVGKDGRVIQYYESKVAPDDPKLIADIEKAL